MQEALDAGAGVFWSLSFIAVWKQENEAREQPPLIFPGTDELIDHRLRNVDEIAELRLPEHQGFGIIATVAIFEAQHTGFG